MPNVLTDPADRERRAEAIRYAKATNALEGLQASAQGEAIFCRYIEGELTVTEMVEAIKATKPDSQA